MIIFYYFNKVNLNQGAFMNLFRLALSAILMLAFSVSTFAQDDDEVFAPRNGKGATVTIITDPPNSDIFLDGEPLGKSPIIKRPFRTGPLKLIVQDQGKDLINTKFNVWPNKENVYQAKTIMPIGRIKVTTNPSTCNIFLDGELADRTDGSELTINSVNAGDHTVGAECGKLKHETLVPVRGEQTTELHLDVQKKKAKATIEGKDVTN
jgi:hypothetical protein